jgi:hypothetical protein
MIAGIKPAARNPTGNLFEKGPPRHASAECPRFVGK